MGRKWIILLCGFVAVLSGCSRIKEDRSVCPCLCSLDFSQVNPDIKVLHLWFFDQAGDLLGRDTLYPPEYGGAYEIELKRGTVNYHIWGNISTGTELTDDLTLNSSLVKMENASADSLFYSTKELNTKAEVKCDTVVMNKEYATVNFTLKGPFEEDENLYLELSCRTIGQYIDGRSIEDRCTIQSAPVTDSNGSCLFRFRIMRQKSLHGIRVAIITKRNAQAVVIEDYPLGDWLIRSGYDMSAINLSDISVVLDVTMGFITIEIADWQTTLPVKIEI